MRGGELATVRGHAFTPDDHLRGRIIELLLCDFRVDLNQVADQMQVPVSEVLPLADGLDAAFPDALNITDGVIDIPEPARPLARIIAKHFDAYQMSAAGHSHAV